MQDRPVLASWRVIPLVRLLSSIPFGIALIVLILVYASVLSALPQVRGALELTEMAAFEHWLFTTLVLLLCLSVTVATLTRIRLAWINAGVLTVHAGLLILCGGAVWYFGSKIEGDVLLRSPRIELVNLADPGQRVLAELLPEKGRRWANVMPAFGGLVELDVLDSEGGELHPVERALVSARLGSGQPQLLMLSANDGRTHELEPGSPPGTGPRSESGAGPRLGLRLRVFPPERHFYDSARPALYMRPVTGQNWITRELTRLPLHRERYLDEGYELLDSQGRPMPSKRTKPQVRLAGLTIPTGWFEPWRLPIRVDEAEIPFQVEITGYVPYVAATRMTVVASEGAGSPAATLRLSVTGGTETLERSLLALEPAASLLDLPTPVELRYVEDSQQRENLLAPLAGAHELTVELRDPPLRKVFSARVGETIRLEGTPYELTIRDLLPSWPLMSTGFEGAFSPAALVDVSNGQARFQRTVIQRYPELSQDIDEQGVRRKVGFVDENLSLRYRSAPRGWILLVADPEGLSARRVTLGVFTPDGQVQRQTLAAGATARVRMSGFDVDLRLVALLARARATRVPVLEPLETRRPNVAARSASAIRLKITGRAVDEGWSETHWCLFSQYPHVDVQPLRVRLPSSGEEWEIVYSRVAHELGAALAAGKLSVQFFPGRESVESWRSDFVVQPDETEAARAASVSTNNTTTVGAWTLFQSGAARDHWSHTILGVGNRRGIWPMVLGCILITVGSLFAFYVKPWLRQRMIVRAEAEPRSGLGLAEPPGGDGQWSVGGVWGNRRPVPSGRR